MARRIMRQFSMREISAVDRPCQEPATMAIMKRATKADDPPLDDWSKAMAPKGICKECGGKGGEHLAKCSMSKRLDDTILDFNKARDPYGFKALVKVAHEHGVDADDLEPVAKALRKVMDSIADLDEPADRGRALVKSARQAVDHIASIVPAGALDSFKAACAAIPAAVMKGAVMSTSTDKDVELTKLRKRSEFLNSATVIKMDADHREFMASLIEPLQEPFAKMTLLGRDLYIKAKKKPPAPDDDEDQEKDDMGKADAEAKKAEGGPGTRATPKGTPTKGGAGNVKGGGEGDKSGSDIDKLQKRIDELETKDEVAICKSLCRENDLPESDHELLMKLRKVDTKAAEEMLKRGKAHAAQLRASGLFTEIGKSGQGHATAAAELQAKAEELMKAHNAANPKDQWSIQKARATVYTDPTHSDLAKRVKAEEFSKRNGRAA